jgi:predicted site-specific integrase-resolvase
MRRRDVCEALGVSADQVRKIVDCGLLKPIRMPGRRAWFRAADVRRLADG